MPWQAQYMDGAAALFSRIPWGDWCRLRQSDATSLTKPSPGGGLRLVRRGMGPRSQRQGDASVNLTMIRDAYFCEMLDSVTHSADRYPAHYCS